MGYIKNVGKSIAYSVPQIVENKLGNIADFAKMITNTESRKEIQDAFRNTRSILKDDYASVLTTGFDNTVKALKSGKFHDPKAAQDAFATDFGGEDGDTWGSWDDNSSSADSGGDDAFGSSQPTADAGVISQSIVRSSTGLAGKLDEVSQAVIQTGEMGANLSRHTLVQQINNNRTQRNFFQMSLARMDRDYGFRMNVEKPYYEESLAHMTAMQAMLGEISDKLSELRNGQAIIATATDISMQLSADNNNIQPSTGLRSMLDASGAFSPVKYINSLNRKLQNIASDSMFGMGMSMAKQGVSGLMMDSLIEGLIPKQASRRMDRMNEWFGELLPLMLVRMSAAGDKRLSKGGFKNTALGNVMKFFGAGKKPEFDVDLSNYAKDKAVSFDGYAHRAIVEVIPTLLGDIHAETVSIRKAMGVKDNSKAGIKAYNYQTGKFTNTADVLKEFNENAEAMAKSNLRLFASRAGGSNTDELQDVFMRMVNSQTQFRNIKDIKNFVQQEKKSSNATQEQRASLNTGFDQLLKMLMVNGRPDLRRMYDLQAAINKGGHQKEQFYQNAMDGREDVTRFAFNSMTDANSELNSVSRRKSLEERSQDKFILNEANQYNNEANDGFTSGNMFRDGQGKMTAKSIYQAPFRMFSKFADDIQEYINAFFFDTDRKKTKIGNFLDNLTDKLFGNSGIFTPLIKGIKDSAIIKSLNKSLDKMGVWLFGEKDLLTGRRSKSKFREEMEKQVGALGTIIKSMMPVEKFKKAFDTGARKVFSWFGASSQDIDAAGGFGGFIRQTITTQMSKFTDSLFGTKNAESGMREGGALGFVTTAARNIRDGIMDKLITPVKTALVGTDGKGGFFGDVKKQFSLNITTPMKEFFFGTKDAEGNRLKLGFFGTFSESFKTKLLDPFKEQASRIFTDFKAGFMNNIVTPFKSALFGKTDTEGAGGDNKRGIVANISATFGKALNYIQEKFDKWLFNPVKTFFTDPEKGIFKRINGWLFDKDTGLFRSISSYLFDEKNGVFTKLNKKLFVGKDSYFERLGNWLNNPKNGILTRLGRQIETGTEAVKLAFKDVYEKFQTKFLEPLRREMAYIWRATTIYFKKEIWKPFQKELKSAWEGAKTFFKTEVFEPLKGTLQPFVEELKFQWKNMKAHFVDIMKSTGKILGNAVNDAFMVGFGKSFTEIMKQNVLDPIKETLGTVKNFLTGVLKQVILAPIKMITGASGALRERHARLGLAYTAGEAAEGALNSVTGTPTGKSAGEKSLLARARESLDRRRKEAAKAINDAMSVTSAGLASIRQKAQDEAERFATAPSIGGNAAVTAAKDAQSSHFGGAPSLNVSQASVNNTAAGGNLNGNPNIGGGNDPSKKKSAAGQIREAIMEGFGKMRGKPRKSSGTIGEVADKSVEISVNTKEIYSFMRKHLLNVGSNLEGIAQVLGATAKGGNTREKGGRGFFGTIKDFIKNPFRFVANLGRAVLDKTFGFATNILKTAGNIVAKAVKPAIDLVTGTVKTVGKVANGMLKIVINLSSVLGDVVKLAGSVLRTLSSIAATAAKIVLDVAEVAIDMTIKMTGAALKGMKVFGEMLLKGSVEVLKSMGSLAAGLLKTGASIANSLLKVTGSLVSALGSATSEILKITGELAKAAGNLVGGAIRGLMGGRASHTIGALTPVYVVGGYLAGTDGGAKSFAEAKSEYSGAVRRITTTFKSKLFGSEGEYKEAMLRATSSMATRLGNLGKGFMDTMKNLRMLLAPIAAGVSKMFGFSDAKDMATKMLSGMGGAKDMATKILSGMGGRGGVDGAGTGGSGGTRRRPGRAAAWARSRLGRTAGNLVGGASRLLGSAGNLAGRVMHGAGLFAAGSMAGDAISGIGDGMEDGIAKTATKTAGRALSWAGTGAMIGSIIPGLGTGIGAMVGGAAGAIYENKDAILDFGKRVWGYVKDGFNTAITKVGEWMSKIGDWLSSKWDTISETVSGWWTTAKDAVISGVGKITDWVKDYFTSYLDTATDFFKDPMGFIADKYNSFKDNVTGAYDWISGKISSFMSDAQSDASALGKAITDKASAMWNGISDSFSSALDWFKSKWDSAKNWVMGDDAKNDPSKQPTKPVPSPVPVTTPQNSYITKGNSYQYPGMPPVATVATPAPAAGPTIAKSPEPPVAQHAQATKRPVEAQTSEAYGTYSPNFMTGQAIGYNADPKILETRGIRNNNLLNIDFRGQPNATLEKPGGRFARFNSPVAGIEAAAHQLMRYYTGKTTGTQLRSLQSIISTWAPSNENDTSGYIQRVSKLTGFRSNEVLDLTKPDVMAKLIGAMAIQENSGHPYTQKMLLDGAAAGIKRGLAKGGLPDMSIVGSYEPNMTLGSANMQQYGMPADMGNSSALPDVSGIKYTLGSGQKGALDFVDRMMKANGVDLTRKGVGTSKVLDGGSPVAAALNTSKQSEGERVKNRVSPTGDQAAIAKATAQVASNTEAMKKEKTEVTLDDSATAGNTAAAVQQLQQMNETMAQLVKLLTSNSNLSKAEKAKVHSQLDAMQRQSQDLFKVSQGARQVAAKQG